MILSEGCVQSDVNDCADSRGHIFTSNQSSTWSIEKLANGGLFELTLYEERKLDYSGNALYGFDNITLGVTGSGMPIASQQLIAGIATPDFWVGSLGLSPLPFNFTNLNNPVPSLLGSLRKENQIPSTSWAYTAGAYYQDPPLFGSLTLGGYDSSRFVQGSEISIPFGPDQSRDLLVGLQSITTDTNGGSPLLSSGIYALINSMVPQLWLPVETCKAFEKAFNLTWNETAELYFVDDALHKSLLAENPTFTFTVGPASKAGESIAIRLPYAAFDQNLTSPLVTEETHYFPLKRAQNNTQYTLGRVFLQEAYIIADYDRANFSIAQALVPSYTEQENLIPILPPVEKSSTGPEDPGASPVSSKKLSPGVIAGIAVGVALIFLGILAYYLRARWSGFTRSERPKSPVSPWSEVEGKEILPGELESPTSPKLGLPSFASIFAIRRASGKTTVEEVHGSEPPIYELPNKNPPQTSTRGV